MTYDEIKALGILYSDRQDDDTAAAIDGFLRIVEARVNKKLKTMKMTNRATVSTTDGQRYYGLPVGFSGFRDIQISVNGSVKTAHYINPEMMNGYQNITTGLIYYTIIDDQLQITPPQATDDKIEIVYYVTVPPLTSSASTNWLSDTNPDCYTFGLMVEISSYAKDGDAKALWEDRFIESIGDIELDDFQTRWSGTPLQIRVG